MAQVDEQNHSSDGGASTSGTAPRRAHTKSSAQARTHPYTMSDDRKTVRPTDLLSCSECRKRKTKCDRQTPCSGCIQRGKPDQCSPDIRRYPPAAAKLSEEILSLREHVKALESFLASKFSDYKDPSEGLKNGNSAEFPPTSAELPDSNTVDVRAVNPTDSRPSDNLKASQSTRRSTSPILFRFNSLQPQGDMQTDRTEQSMASILARFRDSEILGTDKDSSVTETSPSGLSLQQALLSDFPSCPTIRLQPRAGASRTRADLFTSALLAQIPPPDYCRKAVEAYLMHTRWEIFVTCRKQLLAELAEFEALRADGEASDADPAWVALLLIIISMGLLMTCHYQGATWDALPNVDLRAASLHYAELSKAALELADWTTSPSIRVLQTVLITGWRYHHVDARSNSFDGQGRSCLAYRTLLHVAHEHCCALAIDKLPTDESATLASDPSLPNSSPMMKRQFGLRLWFSYAVVETLLSDRQYHRPGPSSDYILPGMYTEDDLLSSFDRPERAVTEDSSLLYLHMQKIIFSQLWRQTQLAQELAPVSDITPTVELYRAQLEDLLTKMATTREVIAPTALGSFEGTVNAIKLFQPSAALRVYRPAILSANFAPDSDLVKAATAEASLLIMISVLAETKQVMLCFPPAVSFLYNAATLLLVTLCPEPDEDVAASRSALLQSALLLLQTVERETRSAAIAENAKKISDALFKLARALLQEGHSLPYIARQRLEAVLSNDSTTHHPAVTVQQAFIVPSSNAYDFTFPSGTMWGAPSSLDHSALNPAIWPDAFTSDPMAMSTDIDGWLKWLDAA